VRCPIFVQRAAVREHLCNYCATRRVQRFKICRRFRTLRCLDPPHSECIRSLADRLRVIRASELKKYRIHHQILRRALDRGTLIKVHRGLYASKDIPATLDDRIVLACKRVPHEVVCLESALEFHALLPSASDAVWMAIDRKARKPSLHGLEVRFVRFSGRALTQGVVNARIDGVPVRIYSAAKTIADCFKYRRKIGIETAADALRASIRMNKCSRERLLHFADICRVGRLLRAAQ
jgi:predicted transcriptional regulator of viral defense system